MGRTNTKTSSIAVALHSAIRSAVREEDTIMGVPKVCRERKEVEELLA
jgi:hypothetical protein